MAIFPHQMRGGARQGLHLISATTAAPHLHLPPMRHSEFTDIWKAAYATQEEVVQADREPRVNHLYYLEQALKHTERARNLILAAIAERDTSPAKFVSRRSRP